MGSSRFSVKVADEESKSIPHEFPRSHWLKAIGQRVIERHLSATMLEVWVWLDSGFGLDWDLVSGSIRFGYCFSSRFVQG